MSENHRNLTTLITAPAFICSSQYIFSYSALHNNLPPPSAFYLFCYFTTKNFSKPENTCAYVFTFQKVRPKGLLQPITVGSH